MPRIIPSTLAFTLHNIALIGCLSAPLLAHASSEPKKDPTTATHTYIAPETATPTNTASLTASKPDSSDTSTGQENSQEKSSILSLKTGCNLLKTLGMGANLLIWYHARSLYLKDLSIQAGLVGTIATLGESIVKDYEMPNKQNNIMRNRIFALCKLIGVIGNVVLSNEERELYILTLSNLAFLGHSLYGDYKSYVASKKNNNNSQSAHSDSGVSYTKTDSQITP